MDNNKLTVEDYKTILFIIVIIYFYSIIMGY